MMHCELLVPGLFAGQATDELPAVELLLARARAASAERRVMQSWLYEAFGLDEGEHPAGALTALGAGREPEDACWTRADPVHLRVMRDRLILVPGHALGVKPDEAAALCDALNAHFAETMRLQIIDPLRWCARLAGEAGFEADCPLDAAGRDVDLVLPTGRGAAHRLLNEAQMLLHGHAVNEAREARGEPAINSLWLWGGGRCPASAAARWQSVAGNEPIALGLARLAGARARSLPGSAAPWLDHSPQEGRHLVVLDSLRAPLALGETAEYREALALLERDWFSPLLAALRAGRIGMLSIHVPDGPECMTYETIRGDLRRFWRRPRRLHQYA
ncbi:MAG TPA: hypothetical protein VE935_21775 [Burkholderiales bacterium]|nr:hypothetical protein [Burkholderiales bacterium]